MASVVSAGTLVVNLSADTSRLKTDMAAGAQTVESSSQKMTKDIAGVQTGFENVAPKINEATAALAPLTASTNALAAAEQARATASASSLAETARLMNVARNAADEAARSFAAIKFDAQQFAGADVAIKQLDSQIDRATASWQEKIAFGVGTGVGVGAVVAKDHFEKFEDMIKTRLMIVGVAIAAGVTVAAVSAVYAAYKVTSASLGFIAGLFSGESYKSENIDALIKLNNEVKTLQENLQLTAVGASALNEALKLEGVDGSTYAATFNAATGAIRNNREELDRLGVTYKDQAGNLLPVEEVLKNAAGVLATYTEGWDRQQAATAIGMGSEKDIQAVLSVSAEKIQAAKERLADYNLIVGEGSQEAVAAYEKAMREFNRESELTSQGFKRAIADQVMPILTQLAEFFRDGFPFAVNAFRYSMATVTSLFYGLKTVVYMVAESVLGSIESIGSGLAGVAIAGMRVMSGDFSGAKDALVKGWTDAKNRLGQIGDNIVEQARRNAAAMRLAWGADSFGAADKPNAKPKTGKAWTPKPDEEEDEEVTDAAVSEYEKLIRAIREKIATQELDLASTSQLTEGQKIAAKFVADLRDGVLDLTDAQKLEITNALESLITIEKSNDAKKEAKRASDELIKAGEQGIKSLKDQVEQQREYNAEIGLSKDAVDAIQAGKLDLAALNKEEEAQALETAAVYAGPLHDAYVQYAAQLREQARLLREQAGLKREAAVKTAAADEAKKAADAWKRTSEQIESSLTDALMRGFEKGKSFAENFRDTLVNMFETLVLRPVIQAIVQPVAGSITSMILGSQGAPAVGGSNLLGTASNLYGAYNGAATVAGWLGLGGATMGAIGATGVTAAAGTGLTLASAGGGLGLTAGGLGSASGLSLVGSGSSLGLTAAAGEASTVGSAIAGAGGTTAAGGLSATLAAIPGWGWAALGGAALLGSGMFDDGPVENSYLNFRNNNTAGNISINEHGNEGHNDSYYVGNYGTGAFGKFGVDQGYYMSVDQPVVQEFIKTVTATDDAFAKLLTDVEKTNVTTYLSSKDYRAETGVEHSNPNEKGQLDKIFADRIKNVMDGVESGLSSLVVGFKGNSQQLAAEATALLNARKNLADAAKIFGESVTLQDLAALKVEGEAASTTIARLVNIFTVTSGIADMLGKSVWSVGLASDAARERLVNLSGGLDALQQGAAFFAQNYLTEAERMAPVIKSVNEQMATLGLSSVTTKEQFKELVQGLEVGSEAGAKKYAELMKIEAAFAQVADYNAKAAAESIAKAQDAARKTQEEQTRAINEARSTLTDAYRRESSALAETISKFSDLSRSLRNFRDELLTGSQSILSPEARYNELRARFDRTYSLAKSGDPTAMGSLQDVSQQFLDASKAYFASSDGYAKDFDMVRSALESSAQAADTQATIAQQQLNALNFQVSGLIDINNNVISVRQAVTELASAMKAAGQSVPTSAFGNGGGGGVTSGLNEFGSHTGIGDTGYRLAADATGATLYFPGGGSHHVAGSDASALLTQTYGLGAATDGTLIRTRAGGGYTPAGLTLVGEEGPELVNFARPSQIYTASQTKEILSAAGRDNEASAELKKQSEVIDRLGQAMNRLAEAIETDQVDSKVAMRELKQHLAHTISRAVKQ